MTAVLNTNQGFFASTRLPLYQEPLLIIKTPAANWMTVAHIEKLNTTSTRNPLLYIKTLRSELDAEDDRGLPPANAAKSRTEALGIDIEPQVPLSQQRHLVLG
jgi:hypothetical protein